MARFREFASGRAPARILRDQMLVRVTLATVTAASVLWAVALAVAPKTLADPARQSGWRTAAVVYAIGAAVCHQRPERSFHTAGVQWPVCARCTGLYVGGMTGLLFWPLVRLVRRRGTTRTGGPQSADEPYRARRRRRYAIAVAAPTLVTALTALAGVFDPGNVSRALLAWPLGTLAGGALAAVLLGDLS